MPTHFRTKTVANKAMASEVFWVDPVVMAVILPTRTTWSRNACPFVLEFVSYWPLFLC